jgi:hypothetical protein
MEKYHEKQQNKYYQMVMYNSRISLLWLYWYEDEHWQINITWLLKVLLSVMWCSVVYYIGTSISEGPTNSSKTLVPVHQIPWCHVSENHNRERTSYFKYWPQKCFWWCVMKIYAIDLVCQNQKIRSGFHTCQGIFIFSFSQHPDWLWGPIHPPILSYPILSYPMGSWGCFILR